MTIAFPKRHEGPTYNVYCRGRQHWRCSVLCVKCKLGMYPICTDHLRYEYWMRRQRYLFMSHFWGTQRRLLPERVCEPDPSEVY